MDKSIDERVIDLIQEQFPKKNSKIEKTSHIRADLGADSLDTVELILVFEDVFDIKITAEEDDQLFQNQDPTVEELITFIKSKV